MHQYCSRNKTGDDRLFIIALRKPPIVLNTKYAPVNVQTIARADGMFLNERGVGFNTLKIKRQ